MLDEIPINVYYNEVLCGNDLHKALKIWLIGQVVKTSPSHGEDRGSTPLLAILYYSVLERVGRNVHSFVVRHNTGGLTGGNSCDLK